MGYDEERLRTEYLPDVLDRYWRAGRPLPSSVADAFPWFTRQGFDIGTGEDFNSAKARHLQELEQALGLHPVPPDPIPGPIPSPLVGRVELIAGGQGGIRDATGPRVVMGCHAGDLLARRYRDPMTVDRALDAIAAAGHQFVRTWTVLPGPWWAARTGEIHPDLPGYWDNLHAYAQALRSRGLRWQVSQGDMCRFYPTQDLRRLFMRNLAQTLIEEGGTDQLVFAVDAGNEAWNGNGESNPDRLADALQAFLDVLPVPLAMTTSARDEGGLAEFHRNNCTVTCYHNSRFAFRHAVERAWTVGYYSGKPRPFALDDEPAGVNSQDGIDHVGAHISAMQEPQHWRDLEAMGTYALAHLISRQAYTLMLSPGVISDEPFESYPALAHAPRVASLLPSDVQSWQVFHGGPNRSFSNDQVLRADADVTPNVRCEHAVAPDGRVAVLIYVDAVGGTHVNLPVIKGFTGEIITPDGSLMRHPLTLTAGQTFGVDLKYGRLLLGRYA